MDPLIIGYFIIGVIMATGFCLWMWYMGWPDRPDPKRTFIDSLMSLGLFFILFVFLVVFWPALFFIYKE